VPLGALVVQSFSVDTYGLAFARAGDSILRSLAFAAAGASLLAVLGFFWGISPSAGRFFFGGPMNGWRSSSSRCPVR
jgi:hypothetical protein